MGESRGPLEDEPTQLNHRGPQPPPFWTSAGVREEISPAHTLGTSGPHKNRTPWAVVGSVVVLAVAVFLLVVVVTQRSQHDSSHAPAAGPSGRTHSVASSALATFPAGLSAECVDANGAKTAITIERIRQSASTTAGSCRFLQLVRDEVDRRGAVTQSYETNLHSDFLAARGKPAWVLLTCGPEQGFIVCRGGSPALEVWVSPKV